MTAKTTKGLRLVGGELPSEVAGPDALRYIQELSESLREMATTLGHSDLATLLAAASEEAGRLAEV
ncbi:MAG TPA: hypothetical protein VGG48_11100 [Rhizomicrobium sp.]